MLIRLKGRSQHGKNRVHQFGEMWEVMDERTSIQTVTHRGCTGPFWLLKSINSTSAFNPDLRWVSIKDDPDFIVMMNVEIEE